MKEMLWIQCIHLMRGSLDATGHSFIQAQRLYRIGCGQDTMHSFDQLQVWVGRRSFDSAKNNV